MKKLLAVVAFLCLAIGAQAQNLTTVSGANITDINGTKLAAGQVCFLITDQSDQPISVSIGGGGQALKRGYCSPVTAGVITGFTVPNPSATLPSGIYYRVTVKDSSSGLEVLRYTTVSFTGATFNFDNYAPLNLGSPAPLSGNSVTGNLSVTGNVAATGTVTGSNIPGSIPGTGACTNQFVTALNNASTPTCSNTIPQYVANTAGGSGTNASFQATGSSFPSLDLENTTGGTDSKWWDWGATATQLLGRTVNDANNNANTWITVTRSGFTPTQVAFSGPVSSTGQISTSVATGTPPFSVASTTVVPNLNVPLVNGVSHPASPSTHQVAVVTAANTATYKTVPDCTDTTGNHINYTQSTDAFSCGTSVPTTLTSENLASPNSTGTDSGTEVLTGKSLGGTGSTTPITPFNRLGATRGTALVTGDVGMITGYGTTATVSAVTGRDSAGSITITSAGTGQAINASFVLTFHDGTWTNAPLLIVTRADGNNPTTANAVVFGQSATTATIGFNGVPVAGQTYIFNFVAIGR